MFLKKKKAMTTEAAVGKTPLKMRAKQGVMSIIGAASMTPVMMSMSNVLADNPTEAIAQKIIGWVGAGGIVIGVITLAVGLMTFFGAEDDGPQKQKGKSQIAAGIGVVAVGGVLMTQANWFAGQISNAFA